MSQSRIKLVELYLPNLFVLSVNYRKPITTPKFCFSKMAENITGPRVITKRTVETVEGDKRHSIYIRIVNIIDFKILLSIHSVHFGTVSS